MSRLNIVRKIRENNQNYNNSKDLDYTTKKKDETDYIMAKMGDVYGQKGNYHLNEYNIEYLGDLRLDKNIQKNNIKIRNIRHNNSKISKGNDLLSINYLKEQFNENNNDKRRGKSSYRPTNLNNNGEYNKKINNNKPFDNNSRYINKNENETDNNKNNQNKTDNLYYTFDNNNNNNFPNNIKNYFMSCKFLFTMSIDEIEEYLESIWKQLYVKDNYINLFITQKSYFNNSEDIMDFLILEIENLKKFEDILIKLKNEIESREKNINQIKNLCEMMNKNAEENNKDDNINNKKLMDDFFNSIISYRVHSIKVIEYYLLFKEKIIRGNSREKFDEENIMKKYGLIKDGCNYLIKMKSDMNFINNYKIFNNRENNSIFQSFQGDPFLSSLYNVIPVSREYRQRIKYCHYYIIQESINENLKQDKIINNKISNLNNNIDNNLNLNNLNDINNYKNYKKKKLQPIANVSNYKEKTQNISTINKTVSNKNREFNPNDSNFSRQYNKSVINNSKNIKENYKKEINKINHKGESENIKISNFNYNNDNLNEDMVNIQTTENKEFPRKLNPKNIEINSKRENYHNLNNNLNINNEKEKEYNNKTNNKEKIKKEENILQNSLTISQKMKNKKDNSRAATPESKKLLNVIPSKNNNENINNLKISIALDNNENNPKKYNTSYYCGSLSDFITIYNNYYQRVPIEQKRIFNIKENPINYFKHNYFPKIIICSDEKLTLVKGICIYSHIFNNNENRSNKIIIEHLSAYKKEEMENILKNIFDFLKNNNLLRNVNANLTNIQNEIYIDLYFYLENEKFVIETQIRDFIKNELKFKWVKLENISKEIRFQKMKHSFKNNNDFLNNEMDDNNILNQSILGVKALKQNEENNNIDTDIDDSEGNIIQDNCNKENDNNNYLFCNFYIKNKAVIKYLNEKEKNSELNKPKNIYNIIKYINPFNFIYLIKKISEDSIYSEYILNNTYNFFKMNEHLDIEEILNNNDGVSLNDILGNNSFLSSNIQKLINNFSNNSKDVKNNFDIKSKINIYPLFDNCISIKYNNFFFNRIENDNIKILIEKETKQKFYFISPSNNKTDNIILLISSTLNEQFKYKYISPQNSSNISLKFIDIYNNITSYESNQNNNNTKSKYLYIPSFIINSKIKNHYKKHRKPENEEDLGIEENNETYIINEYEEYFNIKFISEEFIGQSCKSKNKRNKYSSINFYFNEIEDDYINNKDYIIDVNFIIFILNFDIIDNFAAIPLLSLYITKDNFISEE